MTQKIIIQFLVLVTAVVSLSVLSSRLWGGKPEEVSKADQLAIAEDMTVGEFGNLNGLARPILRDLFGLQSPTDLQKPVTAFGMSIDEIRLKVLGDQALGTERKSKNWTKIFIKFGLWIAFLATVGVLMIREKITVKNRKWLLLGAVAIFGVALGADPSPMGTVKDGIVLLGTVRRVFPPRLIALTVFLLMVIIANKFICAWGCQIGTLQDLIFRLNRDKDDRRGLLRQYKVPFAISNGIRVAFFIALTVVALAWATDIVEEIDPFKLFKPQVLGLFGATFIGAILVASLFIYRPWCHFFCPFGLVGWIAEKLSILRICVDQDKCIACGACEKACPSTVMGAILKGKRLAPDCFACGTCIETCPVGAVSFGYRKQKNTTQQPDESGRTDPSAAK